MYNSTANKIDSSKSTINDKLDDDKEKTLNDQKEKTEKESNSILNRKNYFYSRFTKVKLLFFYTCLVISKFYLKFNIKI